MFCVVLDLTKKNPRYHPVIENPAVNMLPFTIPATFLMTLANLEGDESFDVSMLGEAEEVVQDRISDDELILIKG